MFIAIEGTDGSGKATQSRMLVHRLQQEGKRVASVSFPQYESVSGKLVRKYLDGGFGKKEDIPAEFVSLLYALDRYHFLPQLKQLLKENDVVVCDRYTDSNLAHQAAKFAPGKEQQAFIDWLQQVESRLPVPNLKIFLDIPIPATKQLMKNRKRDIHETDFGYLEATRSVYCFLADQGKNWLAVSCVEQKGGTGQPLSREAIHEKIWCIVKGRIK